MDTPIRRRGRIDGLRVRLFLLVLLAVLPSFGLILYSAAQQRGASIADAQETALRLARLASGEQARRLAGTEELLIALARLPAIQARETERCSALLKQLLEGYRVYANFGAVSPEGEVFCSALPVPPGTTVRDREYFRRALTTGGFVLGEYQIGRITGRASLNAAYPVRDGRGAITGVVFAAIDLAALNDVVRQAQLPSGSSLTVTDNRGTILVRYPDPERWVGQTLHDAPQLRVVQAMRTGVGEAVGLDGTPTLLGFTALLDRPDAGDVYLSIGIPTSAAVATANRQLRLNLLVLAIVATVGFGTAFLASERFVMRPIESLLEGTRAVGSGHLAVRVPQRGGGEVRELTEAFNEMTAALERDRAAREEAQQQLATQRESVFRSERLAAIGRLAAGVAHELRNPLSVIGGRVDLLGRALDTGRVPDADTLRRHLESLGEARDRMQSIMDSLSTASKPPKRDPQILEMAAVFGAIRQLVAYEARASNVLVRTEVDPPDVTACGDRSQLMQILVNLVTNAIEAMGDRGGDVALRARLLSPAQQTVIEVADTGPGMPPERMARVWDAFFTTKPEGTGLGLAIVRSLVEENHGQISVASEAGRGTVFTLVLPSTMVNLEGR